MEKVVIEEKRSSTPFEYYTLLFFLLAWAGWLWEVLLYLVTEHAWINRGIYRGPYLPIYGIGGMLLSLCLRRWRNRPIRVFFISAVSCAVLEYAASFFLEQKWGIRWWDYSGHFLNIQGRICLLGTAAFGIGGAVLICLFLPLYERFYEKLNAKWRRILVFTLLLIFVADAAYCAVSPNVGYGITEDNTMNKTRKTIRVVAAIIRDGDRILAAQKGYGIFKGGWEFPGGKIEEGELPEQALIRELREEMDLSVDVGECLYIVEYDYPDFHLSMQCFHCIPRSGEFSLKEHLAVKWLARETIDSVSWLPADVELIKWLKENWL